jgi:hypothetical protein
MATYEVGYIKISIIILIAHADMLAVRETVTRLARLPNPKLFPGENPSAYPIYICLASLTLSRSRVRQHSNGHNLRVPRRVSLFNSLRAGHNIPLIDITRRVRLRNSRTNTVPKHWLTSGKGWESFQRISSGRLSSMWCEVE